MSGSDTDSEFDSDLELQNVQILAEALNCDEVISSKCPGTSGNPDCYPEDEDKFSEYAQIAMSLALNQQLDERLQRLERVLENRLAECREKLSKVRGDHHQDVDRRESFRYINCGRPYFKDRNSFPAPDNPDTVMMMQNQMFDFSEVTSVPGWTMRDKAQLWDQIETMTKDMKKKELNSKVADLRRNCKKKSRSEREIIETQIKIIYKQINKINKQALDTLALPIDEEYDWEQVTHSLNRRHSAVEYRCLWKLYLHPSINKSGWDKEEHQLLQKLAHENELHGWEEIAATMNRGRTGYQCFVYFRTNMNNTFTGRQWTQEEIAYLLRLVDYYKEDDYIPWVKVTALMENRTKIQIYNKYSRLLEQRKGRFLPEEDAIILTCYDKYGPNYKKITKFLPGRSVSQVRVRFKSLNKKRFSTIWTVEEDKKLLNLLVSEEPSTNYASITKYFPGKDRVNIRARYVTLVKWMRRNPNTDISRAPRRGSRRLGHGKATKNLNYALENLRSRIEYEVTHKKNNKINDESAEDDIEDGIVALIYTQVANSVPKSPTHDKDDSLFIDASNATVNEGNLHGILLLFKAKLNKANFENSPNCNRFPNIKNMPNQSNTVKLKSYSRKNNITNVQKKGQHDIWGISPLHVVEYCLPPHYCTITGCRKILQQVGKLDPDEEPIKVCTVYRNNLLLREQYNLLLDRMNMLFLWPLILSNGTPNLSTIKNYETSIPLHSVKCFPPISKNIEGSNENQNTNYKVEKYKNINQYGVIDLPSQCTQSDTVIKIDMSDAHF